jgi:hypothetical protein
MDTRAHAYAPFYYLTETAKANNVNSYEEVWYLTTRFLGPYIIMKWFKRENRARNELQRDMG